MYCLLNFTGLMGLCSMKFFGGFFVMIIDILSGSRLFISVSWTKFAFIVTQAHSAILVSARGAALFKVRRVDLGVCFGRTCFFCWSCMIAYSHCLNYFPLCLTSLETEDLCQCCGDFTSPQLLLHKGRLWAVLCVSCKIQPAWTPGLAREAFGGPWLLEAGLCGTSML